MTKRTRSSIAKAERMKKLRKTSSTVVRSSLEFVFSVLVGGGSYTQTSSTFLNCNIDVPSESTFYKAQKVVLEEIIKLANDSMNKERSSLKNGSTIALDGSWSHRRNAGQCVVSLINAATNKILDIEILEKNTTGVNGNYEGSSTSMEVEGVRKLLARWSKNLTLQNYIHDNDGKTRSVFKLLMPTVLEQIDKNHLIKTFDRLFKKFNTKIHWKD